MAASGRVTRWRSGWTALAITALARNALSTAVALLLVTLVPAAFGWHPTVVMTPSMEPRIHVGDVIVAQPADPDRLRLGQVLLVDDPDWPGRLRLHRFVRVTKHSRLVLRGDANDHADTSTVGVGAVQGIASLRVPALGLPTVWLRTGQLGPLAAAAAAVALLLAAAFLFQPGEEAATEPADPPAGGRRSRMGRSMRRMRRVLRGRRPKATAAALGAFLLVVVAATPALAAPISATTGNGSDTWATANRFGCGDRVLGDSPMDYWKLGESGGTTATDQKGTRNGTYSASGVTYGVNGPCLGDGDKAVTLSGGASVGVSTSTLVNPATLGSFSEEIWFRADSGASGLMLGLWADPTSATGNNDRVLMMSSNGQVVFGMFDSATLTGAIAASPSTYQDSTWHLATATYSASGMTLYVDGASVATHAAVTPYTGANEYWRIGYGDVSYSGWKPSGAGTPANAFTGSLAQAATYGATLSATQAANHYGARTRSCTSATTTDSPSRYWKLSEASGTTAADSSGNGLTGTYTASGVTYGGTGPCQLEGTTAVTLSGAAGVGVVPSAAGDSITAPTVYSEEIWFKTTTAGGGFLVGFFNNRTGGSVDRFIYMRTDGKVVFGMWSSSFYPITTSSTYNDGAWHHAAATWSSGSGMKLYMDGSQVATGSGPGTNYSFTAYWRVGYGDTGGWPGLNQTSSPFAGSVAGAALYTSVLTPAQVAAHAASR